MTDFVTSAGKRAQKATVRRRISSLLLSLMIFSSAVFLQILQGASGSGSLTTGEGDSARQIVYLALFLGSLALLFSGPRTSRPLLPVSILALLAWSWLSLFWAIEPAIALRRLALTTMILTSIYVLVDELGAEPALRVLGNVLLAILVVNYYWVAMGTGVHQVGEIESGLAGNWRGATVHKNVAGALSALAILLLLFYPNVRGPTRLAFLILSALFLIFSQSKTSIALTIVSIISGLAYMSLSDRLKGFILPSGFIALLCGAAIGQEYILYQIDQLLLPGALTGRGQIWQLLIQFSSHNLFLGSGYGSFWNIGDASPVSQLTRGWVSRITTGHNGYLDLLVQIGLPGLVLALFATVIAPLWKLTTRSGIPPRTGGALTSLLIFAVGQNVTETSLFDRDIAVWVVMAVVLAAIRCAANSHLHTVKRVGS